MAGSVYAKKEEGNAENENDVGVVIETKNNTDAQN